VDDLLQRIEAKVSGTLLYSYRFWAAHLGDTMTNKYGSDALVAELVLFACLSALLAGSHELDR